MGAMSWRGVVTVSVGLLAMAACSADQTAKDEPSVASMTTVETSTASASTSTTSVSTRRC